MFELELCGNKFNVEFANYHGTGVLLMPEEENSDGEMVRQVIHINGYTVCYVANEEGVLETYAVCSHRDQFSRPIGRYKAFSRALYELVPKKYINNWKEIRAVARAQFARHYKQEDKADMIAAQYDWDEMPAWTSAIGAPASAGINEAK